jgi:hypothetical protein
MDEFLDINVRPADEVAARILILFALNQRLIIEDLMAQDEIDEEDDPDELHFDLGVFLDASGARSWLTPTEASWLERSPGELSETEMEELTDSATGFRPLLSASLPNDAGHVVDLSEANVRSLSQKLTLPTDERAADLRETAEILLWRAEVEVELRESSPAAGAELIAAISETATEASEAGLIGLTPRGDFDTGGKPLSDLDEVELTVHLLEATARLRAMNWLCGFGSTWDDVPLDL